MHCNQINDSIPLHVMRKRFNIFKHDIKYEYVIIRNFTAFTDFFTLSYTTLINI